ncbi:hypothetical protein IP91_01119 [Pseudoduganella lurida]|uniref:Uncharacterized protein n=1 Tax=Pseudoduganella lurida TaxID=1036180 RepID=A0A562RLY0_9BURK|nr:hypothetical protein [Pseudoduganella lurida]TWI70041.1 hypothetical protein IP91_01119 [Pseudoduganella lurida]
MRARLLRDGFPRLQMLILVVLTGVAGFCASAGMLAAGLHAMGLRYLLAMGVAYMVFLALLWLWLRTSAADYIDIVPTPSTGEGHAGAAPDFAGGGGTFDGGGASANVDFGSAEEGIGAAAENSSAAIGAVDEGTIPLAVILLLLGVLLSSLFVVWSAPVLFAEILVDALLAAGLYRKLRLLDARHWMVAAVKRTVIPFALTTLIVAGAGWAIQAGAPEARSLGEAIAARPALRGK